MEEGFVYADNKSNFLSNNNLELVEEKGEIKIFQTKEMEVYQIKF